MKTMFKALFASQGLLLAGQAAAQNLGQDLTVLYSFPPLSAEDGANNAGAYPTSGLAASSNMLYGFTAAGGVNGSPSATFFRLAR